MKPPASISFQLVAGRGATARARRPFPSAPRRRDRTPRTIAGNLLSRPRTAPEGAGPSLGTSGGPRASAALRVEKG